MFEDKFNCNGIGTICTWYTQQEISNKIAGKLTFYNKVFHDFDSDLETSSNINASLIWVVYLRKRNSCMPIKTENELFSKLIMPPCSTQIGLSLVKVTKSEEKTIFFYGFDGYIIKENVVLDVLPYESEYQIGSNFESYLVQSQEDSQLPAQQLIMKVDCDEVVCNNSNLCNDTGLEHTAQELHCPVEVVYKECKSNEYVNYFDDNVFEANSPLRLNSDFEEDVKVESAIAVNKDQCVQRKVKRKKWKYFDKVYVKDINGPSKKFQCLSCNKHFANKNAVASHVKLHTGESEFRCFHCNRTYTTKAGLITHMRLHKGEKGERRYKCMICKNHRFISMTNLRIHLRSKHADKQIIECDICSKIFIEHQDLLAHKKFHKDLARNTNQEDYKSKTESNNPDVINEINVKKDLTSDKEDTQAIRLNQSTEDTTEIPYYLYKMSNNRVRKSYFR